MEILNKEQIVKEIESIKENQKYRVVKVPEEPSEIDKSRLFQHDIRGAIRTYKFIADKSIPKDTSPVNIKKRELVKKHLETLHRLLEFYETLAEDLQ